MSNHNDSTTFTRILELMDCAEFKQAAELVLGVSRQRSEQAIQAHEANKSQLLSESDQIAKVAEFLFNVSADPSKQKICERFNSNDKLREDFDSSIKDIAIEVDWFVEFFIKANDITYKNRIEPMSCKPGVDPNSALRRLTSQYEEDKAVDYLIHQVHLDIEAYLEPFYFVNHSLISQLTGRSVKKGFYYLYVSLCQELPDAEIRLKRIKETQTKVRNILVENEKNPRPSLCRFPEDQSIRSKIIRLLSKNQ